MQEQKWNRILTPALGLPGAITLALYAMTKRMFNTHWEEVSSLQIDPLR